MESKYSLVRIHAAVLLGNSGSTAPVWTQNVPQNFLSTLRVLERMKIDYEKAERNADGPLGLSHTPPHVVQLHRHACIGSRIVRALQRGGGGGSRKEEGQEGRLLRVYIYICYISV